MSQPRWVLVTGGTVVDRIIQVDAIPNPSDITHAKDVQLSMGGNGSNIAVGLAKLNNKALLYSQIGNDRNGDFILKQLKKTNVDIRGLRIHPNKKTGSCLILIEQIGTQRLISLPGVHVLQQAENLSPIPWNKLDALVFAHSYLEVDLAIARENEKHHLPIITLPGPAILHNSFEKYLPLLQKSLILILNQQEALTATQSTTLSQAISQLHDIGPQIIIITRGSDGVFFSEYQHLHEMKAFKPKSIVDQTGAGDAFAVGFLHAYLRESTISEAVLFGQAVSAIKLSSLGAQSGLPTLIQVKSFLESQEVNFPIDVFE